MRMTCRYDELMVCMLNFGQLFGDAVAVVIVDECDGAYDCGTGARRSIGNQAITNQVAKRLGPVRAAKPGDEIVEAFEKIGIESDSDSTKDSHSGSWKED